jgi:hypothetical protein
MPCWLIAVIALWTGGAIGYIACGLLSASKDD